MGARLGHRRPEASWVVSATDGLPTDYTRQEMHAELFQTNEVIVTGADLIRRLLVWKAAR